MVLEKAKNIVYAVLLAGVLACGGALTYSNSVLTKRAVAAETSAKQNAADLKVAQDANAVLLDTIAALRKKDEADQAAIAKLAQSMEAIRAQQDAQTHKLASLVQQNAKVREYLQSPVPDDLRRLYDAATQAGGKDRNGDTQAVGKPAGAAS